jgi:hypothetical protein
MDSSLEKARWARTLNVAGVHAIPPEAANAATMAKARGPFQWAAKALFRLFRIRPSSSGDDLLEIEHTSPNPRRRPFAEAATRQKPVFWKPSLGIKLHGNARLSIPF